MARPITPNEVVEAKIAAVPDAVFEVFNDLIAKAWNGRSATVFQKDVVDTLEMDYAFARDDIYDNHWLDVEPAYIEAGWKVEYDSPGYNETYPATFKFTKSK